MARTPKKNDKKANAKALFMTGNFQQKEIAEVVGVTPKTITEWVRNEKWDLILESQTSTKEKRIARYQKYLNDSYEIIENRPISENIPTNGEIDRINKLESTIKKLQDKASIGEIVTMSREVLNFTRTAFDIDKAKELSAVFDAYIKSKLE
ncbi:terminase gpP N-terminus-related DNA-binding protein [Dysgonomonas sp. ZJ279]|uniref:terminase gpP N-terminus-related DNA-binding protein n=1 Tax=Dysgonomonas sp. ZJ279 TaxID=2709796 RepID=UPI0013EDBD4E|nr:hypothetical protein [Dysgonomonas sp. ZJ279]